MKKYILVVFILSILSSCNSTSKLHTETYKGKEILVGLASKSDFQKTPYKNWFDENYNNYNIDEKILNKLKPIINNYTFVVLMGTWCPDSREQVPVFFKILDKSGYLKTVPIYTLIRKYKNDKIAQSYNIKRVPTIIVYQNGKEIGRMIEYPMESIEKDLKKIIIDKTYKHELDN